MITSLPHCSCETQWCKVVFDSFLNRQRSLFSPSTPASSINENLLHGYINSKDLQPNIQLIQIYFKFPVFFCMKIQMTHSIIFIFHRFTKTGGIQCSSCPPVRSSLLACNPLLPVSEICSRPIDNVNVKLPEFYICIVSSMNYRYMSQMVQYLVSHFIQLQKRANTI